MQRQPYQHQDLYRRSNGQQHQEDAQKQSKASPQSNSITSKPETKPNLHRYPSNTKYTIKKYFRRLVIFSFLAGLLVYALALIFQDWPPSSAQLNSDGSVIHSQGNWWLSPNLTSTQRYMLVVAHPDDESLFFSPALVNLASPRLAVTTGLDSTSVNNSTLSPTHHLNLSYLHPASGHILCLSSGNFDGLGHMRVKEMKASCQAFGIPSSHCTIINDADLPDSMSVWWDAETVAEYVKSYVDLWTIDLIITFDHQGVSNHANHRAIAAALTELVQSEPAFPATFMLRSGSLIEKYLSLLALPFSLVRHYLEISRQVITSNDPSIPTKHRRKITESSSTSSHRSLILSSPRQYWEGRQGFSQHVSQNVWFRRLWLVFSRFMWINELVRVV